MTDKEILQGAIEKAEANGYIFLFGKRELIYRPSLDGKIPMEANYSWMFDVRFAKAFWGGDKAQAIRVSGVCLVCGEEANQDHDCPDVGYVWQRALQKMVLEESPIKYLEKFL